MRKKTMTLKEESQDARFQIHKLVTQGFSEHHALARVFPGDPNRRRHLKVWQQHGLWPIPADELEQWQEGKNTPEKTGVTKSPDKERVLAPEAGNMLHADGLEQFVSEVARREMSRLFDNVAISPIPKTGKKGRRAIKKAFTVPSDLWTEIEELFPGEIMSNVISAALRLYVNSKKELDQQSALKN